MKKITFTTILILNLININQSFAQIKTFIYEQKIENAPEIYIRNDIYSQNTTLELGKILEGKEIDLDKITTLTPFLRSYKLNNKDEIIFNSEEKLSFYIIKNSTKTKQVLYPCILWSNEGKEKAYGFINNDYIKKLKTTYNRKESSTKKILNFNTNPEMTVIYAILPKNRQLVGKLMIKHHNKWVKQANGNILTIPALGRSQKNDKENKNLRLAQNTDMPQGIYMVSGIMSHAKDLSLDNQAYLNIDDALVPPGGSSYFYDSFLLSALVPKDSLKDYWISEFSLAHALGRNAIRVHGNNAKTLEKNEKDLSIFHTYNVKKLHPTNGCLNIGTNLKLLIDTLTKLNVINNKKYDYKVTLANNNIFSWNITDKLGYVFLIVKDED